MLKLKSLGKKQLPPLKKKGQGLHFNNEGNGFISPNKNGKHPAYPNTEQQMMNTRSSWKA